MQQSLVPLISGLLAIAAIACHLSVMPTVTDPVSTATTGVATATDVRAGPTATVTATSTPRPVPTRLPTPTPLPPLVQPPTPAPPSDEWIEYRYSDNVSFRYPANWFVYEESDAVMVANFRLDSLLKGYAGEKVKIDILVPPRDMSKYPTLRAYLDAHEETDASGNENILGRVDLPHEKEGYEVVRQTLGGLMGNPEATYERIYVSSRGEVVVVVVYGEKYVDVVDGLAGTLEW